MKRPRLIGWAGQDAVWQYEDVSDDIICSICGDQVFVPAGESICAVCAEDEDRGYWFDDHDEEFAGINAVAHLI
jgi:hypothetical protein